MWCSILQVYPCIKSTLHNYLGHWQHWPTSSQKNYEAIIPKTPMFLTLTLKCLNLLPLCINPIISYLLLEQLCLLITIKLNIAIYKDTILWPLYICTVTRWTLTYCEQETHTHNSSLVPMSNEWLWTLSSTIV